MSGLFDFVKSIGKKIFGEGEDPAAKIKAMIEKDNPGSKDEAAAFKDGVCPSAAVAPTGGAAEGDLLWPATSWAWER